MHIETVIFIIVMYNDGDELSHIAYITRFARYWHQHQKQFIFEINKQMADYSLAWVFDNETSTFLAKLVEE